MLTKLVFNDSYEYPDDQPSSIVPIASTGLDSAWMTKHAATVDVFADEIASLKPSKTHTVLHIIALGDEEFYGPNRNGDAFSKKDTVTAHRTFKELGHVFRNHKNTDPALAVGEVIATAHNDIMNRIELLIALDNDKCRKEIDMLANGESIPFSMGSLQDYDVCSICEHKAETAEEHCDHIQSSLCEVLSDGRIVYMKNPNPKFFDISIVFRPADRIAYSLRKIGSQQRSIGGHELAEAFSVLPNTGHLKRAYLVSVAELLKEIPATMYKIVKPKPLASERAREWIKQAALHFGPDAVLCSLTKQHMLVPIDDVAELIFGLPVAPYARYEYSVPFDDIISSDIVDLLDSFSKPCIADIVPDIPIDILQDVQNAYSMNPDHVSKRVIVLIIEPKTSKTKSTKEAASPVDDETMRGLAILHTLYKLGFVMRHYASNRHIAKYAAALLHPYMPYIKHAALHMI